MTEQKSIEQYVTIISSKSSLDYKGMWPNDIIIEIACDIGEQILHDRHPNTEHLVEGKEGDQDCSYFTEESQDLFDQYYDEVTYYLESNYPGKYERKHKHDYPTKRDYNYTNL